MPLSHPDSECNPSGLRYFIGGDIDVGLVDQARSKFQDAKIHKHYENNRGRHLFVALDDLENFTKTVVDSWLDNQDNISRVAPGQTVGLKAHAPVRISPLARPVPLPNGIREEKGIVVMIPLQRMGLPWETLSYIPANTLLLAVSNR
ncbi:hypothetical protein LTR91_020841 [Friedmanniomyces endolithicus]|uniref:Uncharacterized protein n=2 Tax=Friedmanniomyces TaxID=329881 RepID=A0AAN6HBQ6_9PEZI|nr:hypothetical protein LTR87_017774 [Friedmanniomyces endolithicus]KAK0903985.1 hypothetical protein LTR57_018908 [Friedmanniomyces endolithicus]KAK0959465.1 hypothetical protein LTR91_020841 [Friedmanniomyces endolithicus]KAK1022736.1 hypothetical protein LTS16_025480 [Friedmanniomyces endolithicus]